MKRKLLLLLAIVCFCQFSFAQNCDPWVVQAYNQLYGRKPTAQECNIKNYNNGSWNNYCELVGYIAAYNRYKAGNFLKGDPWIFQVYCEVYNRAPNAWELNTQNYNNGSWNNYGELKRYVQQYQSALSQNNLFPKIGDLNGNTAVVFTDKNNNAVAVDLVSKDGGRVIAAGGGNVISAGGDNVIAPGGGNVIAPGGGNLIVTQNMPGLSFGSDRTLQSVGTRVISTAGKTKLVIR